MTTLVLRQPLRFVTARLLGDALRRGAALLLLNSMLLALFGMVFWAVGARLFPEAAVGAFAGVTSAAALMAAVAALGLPTTMMRHLVPAGCPRDLVVGAVAAVGAAGTAACLVAVVLVGPFLPGDLGIPLGDADAAWVTALAVVASVGAVTDAALIAVRAPGAVVAKNLAGSVVKVVALPLAPLVGAHGTTGLLVAYTGGAAVAALLGWHTLSARLVRSEDRSRPLAALRRHARFSRWSYLGTVVGITPLTIYPLLVLAIRGPQETAWFAVALMVAGFLTFVPSTTAQVLVAEVARDPGSARRQTRVALTHVYGLLTPAALVLIVAAPLILSVFGPAYREGGTATLRLLALGALISGAAYLVDSLLAARDRIRLYVLMNLVNAVLVLGLAGALLPQGLAASAVGWCVAQALSLAAGLIIVRATGILRRPAA